MVRTDFSVRIDKVMIPSCFGVSHPRYFVDVMYNDEDCTCLHADSNYATYEEALKRKMELLNGTGHPAPAKSSPTTDTTII